MAQPEEDEGNGTTEKMVAMYDFDPSTIDWPYHGQRPLALQTGQVIQLIHDDGGEWALGHIAYHPEIRGYFPRNYTVSVTEYHDMMRDYEEEERGGRDVDEMSDIPRGPPETRAIPEGTLPQPTDQVAPIQERLMGIDDDPELDPELVYPGLANYPVLEARPPLGTTFEPNKSKMLREMPPVPDYTPEDAARPDDDVLAAREEVERELAAQEDPYAQQGGKLSDSRASTPATYAMTRPERDFVREPGQPFVRRHIPMDLQNKYLKPVAKLDDLVRKQARMAWTETPAYQADLRVRATTCRLAANIEPPHMRMALQRAASSGAKWTQMFRPGFNDIVNESFKVGCNASLLSKLYIHDKDVREQFQKMHAMDVNGTLWFELQRRKEHLFYMRMDFVDVMMCHPDAWGFPDTNRIVSPNPGEPVNPFHGWYSQRSIDTDKEMEEVEFTYTLRLRAFPEQTFQALALGKIPEWVQPYLSLHAEAQPAPDPELEEEEADVGPGKGNKIDVDKNLMMEAGLEDGDDLYVKLDELRLAKERTAGPDVLDARATVYKLKGLSAMRIFLRSRGNPDNMKQTMITPKIVKDMAAQLGIRADPARYWYCMFALRYPLASDWEAVVKNDTRWYLHLPSDRLQPIHPMIRRFREHLDDCMANEFLWDYRGFVKMKCAECGLPDSVIWCHQCTDYFCAQCFLQTHKSKRGKKHWPMPIPGSRYLSGSEAARLRDHVPLLNTGFSNRRRFLARDNQSDKNGSRSGDTWLFFHADTFQAALLQAPEKHWYLKRLKPPRLSPGVDGYYYNFQNDVIADDASHILSKAHEQKAVSILQKNIRGAITRRRVKKETEATIVIQKSKMMWDVQKVHGNNGKNAALLKSWFRKYKAKDDKAKLIYRVGRIQSIFRGMLVRKEFKEMLRNLTRFQASFRGILARRRHMVLLSATQIIQNTYRGRLYGRLPMRKLVHSASKIQAMARGVAQREIERMRARKATYIQARYHGMVSRKHVKHINAMALKLQRNWRRFQAQLDVKIMIYEKMEVLRRRRQEILREKLEDAAAILMQRNFRRHRDYQKVVFLKREKGEADKRTSTMLVALFTGAANMRHFVHPWWRHLPTEIQEVLQQIKGSLQRTIAQVPITGKLANEELGKRGLRVASAGCLTYDQAGKDPDLASHLLLSVTRHLLSHIPGELFGPTVRWACHALGHQAVDLNALNGTYPKEEVPVGKEMPPHPGDSLATLWTDVATIKHRHDWQIATPDESLPVLVLSGLPSHHRHVFLTAEVLVTMRQALDSPAISTDDHLKFQGLDSSAGAQLMEVLGSEIDHRLPLDWPKVHGTVAALAAQMGTHITELKPDKKEVKAYKPPPKKAAEKAKAKAKLGNAKDAVSLLKKEDPDEEKKKAKDGKPPASEKVLEAGYNPDFPEAGILSSFNRAATLRVVQQCGYLMSDQDNLLEAVLTRADELSSTAKGGQGVRQSRYISVTDKLFEMADRAKHDHCSFTLAVVLYHMVLRALMLRVLYHRAALAIQKRYRYLKVKKGKLNAVAPAVCIQRFWRGTKAALIIVKRDDAASLIQHNYKSWKWNQRSAKLLKAVLRIQRVWTGAVYRKWLRTCHKAATTIQKFARGLMVRLVLDQPYSKDKKESTVCKIIRTHQAELTSLIEKKSSGEISESFYMSKTAVIAGRCRVALNKHRERNTDMRRMASFQIKSAHARKLDKQKKLKLKGAIQPMRLSVFEPMVVTVGRMDEVRVNRYGAHQSRVLQAVKASTRQLERSLPNPPTNRRTHVCSRRGRRAIVARRVAKKPKVQLAGQQEHIVDDSMMDAWMASHFNAS